MQFHAGTITQKFGPSNFNYKPFGITRNNGYFHDGLDIGAPTGTKYPAPESGTVTYQGFEPGGAGNYVVFKGDSGHELLIMHLSRFPGTGRKSKGQAIGYVGSSGNSTGPHSHTTVYPRLRNRWNGVKGAIDPQSYLKKISQKEDLVTPEEARKLRAENKGLRKALNQANYALATQAGYRFFGKLLPADFRRKFINYVTPNKLVDAVKKWKP